MLRTLLQPRYAALSVLMVIVAGICIAAGTWQIYRLGFKITANDALRRNAHARVEPLGAVLPLVGQAQTPSADDVQFRTVSVAGTYDTAGQVLVRQRTVDTDTGYLVLTPLRASGGTLLVVRGFLDGTSSNGAPPVSPAPPSGSVNVTARIEPGENRADKFAALGNGQVESINPIEQASRLGIPVYNGYAELLGGQPGSAGLVALPSPDLSNPAGGAVEPQHLAYIIQWYLFAGLALAAPIVMARSETRREGPRQLDDPERVRDLGAIADARSAALPAELSPDERRAARLADRYGRVVR